VSSLYKHLAHLLVALLVFSALTVLAGLSSVTYTTYADTSSDCTITLRPGDPGDSISHYIQSAPSNSTVCLLPGEYRVGALDIANKTLTIRGLGSKPGDVKIVLTEGSLKLAPRGNETIVIRNLGVEGLTDSPAVQIYYPGGASAERGRGARGSAGVVYDIGEVVLDTLLVNATRAIATSVQVGPHIKIRSFVLNNSVILAGDTGVQIGPHSSATGVIVIDNNTIRANKIGIQVGPGAYAVAYLRISHNNITAGEKGIQVGPPTGANKAHPRIDILEVICNTIASNTSNVLEIRSFITYNASIYLNTFLGNGSRVEIRIDTKVVDINKVFFNTPNKNPPPCNGRCYVKNLSYLGNYYVDWTQPDNDSNCIVDIPRNITRGLVDAYPLTDPLSLFENQEPESAGVVMGGGVLVDYSAECYLLVVAGLTLLATGELARRTRLR
jgi:hypothetical protein